MALLCSEGTKNGFWSAGSKKTGSFFDSVRQVTVRLQTGGTISGSVRLVDGRPVGGLVLVPFRVAGADRDFERIWQNLFGFK